MLACLLFGFAQALVVLLGGRTVNIPPQLLSIVALCADHCGPGVVCGTFGGAKASGTYEGCR